MNNNLPPGLDIAATNYEELVGKSGQLRRYSELDISQVQPGPWQPRQVFGEEELAELAASIDRDGQLDPILVLHRDGTYLIVAGERRYRAIQSLGRGTIEAILIAEDTPEPKLRELAIISNVQRENLDPFEEASSYQTLMDEYSHTLESLGEMLGKKKSTIHDVLQINSLPEEWRTDFRSTGNRASKTMLVEIAREKDPQMQLTLWESVRDGSIKTVREAREKKKPKRAQAETNKRQRYLREMQQAAKRASELAKEGTNLSQDEFQQVLTDWDIIDAFIQEQRKKLEE